MRMLKQLGLAVAILAAGPAMAQEPEKRDVVLGVGGAALLYYLPLAIAQEKGFFGEEGLNVSVNDFRGGSQSLQALVGGSADVVTGAYEHTIRMQARGQDIRAVIELGRFPGLVLAVKSSLADEIATPADLRGRTIGVTAPGSSSNHFVSYILAKEGITSDDVSFIGIGAGATAVAAIRRGEIHALSNVEPVITTLELAGDITVLADTRTEEGMQETLGAASLPSAVLYTRASFIEQNPNTVQALVNALHKALKWLEEASAEDVAEAVPPQYIGDDREVYLQAVRNSLPTYSRTGRITEEGKAAALELLSFDAELATDEVDLSKTFDGRFVERLEE